MDNAMKSATMKQTPTNQTAGVSLHGIQVSIETTADLVFARHPDNFIVNDKFYPFIGPTPSGQLHHDIKRSSTYRDWQKNKSDLTLTATYKPPGCWATYRRFLLNIIAIFTITSLRLQGLLNNDSYQKIIDYSLFLV